jgi:D-alanine-D-alanine ligase
MNSTVVGVLRGGTTSEHDISLLSGHAIVANLPRDRYTTRDIYIDKRRTWHERGKPSTPADILRTIDVVISTLHGEYGESGEVQRILEQSRVPYVGADSVNSYFSLHKAMSKQRAAELGINIAKHRFIEKGSDPETVAYEITRTFSQPVVVKPLIAGSSVGVTVVGGYYPTFQAIQKLLAEHPAGILVEEYIRGVEASVGVVEGLRGEAFYVLPTVEVVLPVGGYISHEGKKTGQTEYLCPGRFDRSIHEQLSRAAETMHQALGQRHYSQSDFIVGKKGIYFLELNSAAGTELGKDSPFARSLAAVGVSFPDFLSHVLASAVH